MRQLFERSFVPAFCNTRTERQSNFSEYGPSGSGIGDFLAAAPGITAWAGYSDITLEFLTVAVLDGARTLQLFSVQSYTFVKKKRPA